MKKFRDYQEVLTLDGLCRLVVFKEAPPSSSQRLQISLRAEFTIEVSPDTTPQELPQNVCRVGPHQKSGILAFEAIAKGTQLIGFDLADLRCLFGGKQATVHQLWSESPITFLKLSGLLQKVANCDDPALMLAFHLPKNLVSPLSCVVDLFDSIQATEAIGFISFAAQGTATFGVTLIVENRLTGKTGNFSSHSEVFLTDHKDNTLYP